MARRTTAALASGVLVIVLWGCGAAATPIPSTGGSSAAASQAAAPSEAPPSAAAPSAAEASAAAPSTGGGEASFALPSITLPSDAKDLEALLPSTLCGSAATKASVSGASLGQTVDPTFLSTLQALGKSVNDVAFAFAFSQATSCGAGIFRIQGVDPGALQSTMVAQEQKSGDTFTQGNVGGKAVFISDSSSGGGKQYVYFHGDAVIFAQAPDETKAATILQALP
jgi:hypothetical protein